MLKVNTCGNEANCFHINPKKVNERKKRKCKREKGNTENEKEKQLYTINFMPKL